MEEISSEQIIQRNVEDEMKSSYLRYSMSVIISRALPDVRDGLKPSQRRILYAMRQLNLGPNGKHRKCAKISGDTSGDYHPHGEQVIYPTLARMAQDWIMRYPLVNGQGNFGSIDGDPPAAMRYTEARLTQASLQLMEDLEKDAVDMVSNYDETKKEPVVYPAKFPNLLCNGSSGIAVGMATNIPPHNLRELVKATMLVLEDPEVSIEDIMQEMPGPDFPTGGMICGYEGIRDAYRTGRGKLTLRGIVNVEDSEKQTGRQRLVITEVPYNTNKSRLIEHLAELINNKVITGVSDLRDESDREGIRIVLELKRGEVPEVIINQLYKFSSFQDTFGCILLALKNGMPTLMNVKEMIESWIEFRIEVIRRCTRYDLKKAEERVHILSGYLKALANLDDIVSIVRTSNNREEAKNRLIENFEFTIKQAHAILDLRIYQLTGMEREKIQKEHDDLLEKIAHYKEILASEEMVKDIIRDQLAVIERTHKSPRKTRIEMAEGDMGMEDLIPNETLIMTISQDDYIKRMPIDVFREQRRGGCGISGVQMKQDDILKKLYVVNTHDYLMIFTSLGRCYWLRVWQIPDASRKSKGRPLVNFLEGIKEDEHITAILSTENFDREACVLMATKKGIIKKTDLKSYSKIRKGGIWALNLQEGDEMISARLVDKGQEIMLFTRNGMAVRFDENKIREIGRVAKGVRGVTLRDPEDKVVGLETVSGDETVLIVCERGFGKRSNVGDFRKTNRGGVGVRSILTSERNGKVVSALCVSDTDGILMMSKEGQGIRIPMKDVRVMGRSTQGVTLVNLKSKDHIVAVQKVEESEEETEIEEKQENKEV